MPTPKHIVAVSALVKNPQGDILLVKSPRRGWEMPGGQVEEGETLLDALTREVREEAGVETAVGQLVGIYSNIQQPTKVIFGFLSDYVSGELTTSRESLETVWIAPDTALTMVDHPAICDRLRDMLTFAGQVNYRVYSTNPYRILSETTL